MQTTQRRIVFAAVLLLGLAWIFVSADRSGTSTAGKIPAPQTGFLAPDFELQTMDGQAYKLSDLRGQVVLVNLWASWCIPCRSEMPAMQTIYEDYKGQGFVVLAVNSTVQDTPAAVQKFVAEYGLTFPVLMDTRGDVSKAYQLQSLPTSFFVGRDGLIREIVVGGLLKESLLRARVEALLAEK